MEGDPDAVETPPQAVVVEARAEEVTIDRTQHFVDAITENKTTIFDRHACFGTGHEGAAHVNDVFGFHLRWNGEERCAIAPNRARMAKSGLGASGRVLATAGAEHRGESGRRIGKRSGEGPVGAHRAAELHRRRAATGGGRNEYRQTKTDCSQVHVKPPGPAARFAAAARCNSFAVKVTRPVCRLLLPGRSPPGGLRINAARSELDRSRGVFLGHPGGGNDGARLSDRAPAHQMAGAPPGSAA